MESAACCSAPGLSAPIRALLHSKISRRSSRGMPNRSANTRSGISAETVVTRSMSPSRSATISRAFSSIEPRSRSIDLGVKTGCRIRRSRVCRGWSMLSIIWRNRARLSSVIEGTDVPPASEEKRSWSRSTSLTSAWEVTTQNPGLSTNWSIGLSPSIPAAGGSTCQAMPPLRRSTSKASWGTPAMNGRPTAKSTSTRSATRRAPAGGIDGVSAQTVVTSVGRRGVARGGCGRCATRRRRGCTPPRSGRSP